MANQCNIIIAISWELQAVYIVKLLAYSIQDTICKILIDCGKFHVIHDMMPLLSLDRSEYQLYTDRLNRFLFVSIERGQTVCQHTLIVTCIWCLWWFSLLLADLCLVAICLSVCSWWLVVAGYYYYCKLWLLSACTYIFRNILLKFTLFVKHMHLLRLLLEKCHCLVITYKKLQMPEIN